jgi:hypothetical protein
VPRLEAAHEPVAAAAAGEPGRLRGELEVRDPPVVGDRLAAELDERPADAGEPRGTGECGAATGSTTSSSDPRLLDGSGCDVVVTNRSSPRTRSSPVARTALASSEVSSDRAERDRDLLAARDDRGLRDECPRRRPAARRPRAGRARPSPAEGPPAAGR